jgi:hypothetical protein
MSSSGRRRDVRRHSQSSLGWAVTENAKPVLELIGNVISDTYVEAMQGVSSDEIGTMVKVLTRVHSNLSVAQVESRAALLSFRRCDTGREAPS